MKRKTDALGRFMFDSIRAGIRVTVDAVLDKRLIGRAYTLGHARGRARRHSPGRHSVESDAGATGCLRSRCAGRSRAATSDASSDGGRATDTVTFDANGMPIVSSDVTVVANMPMLSASTEAGKVTLEPEQVTALPSLGSSDIFRALQWLPGVSSNETSSGLFVRGGTPDQNLVDFDGFTVYNVDHLFGYFSAFNMDAIDSVDLSKGAYEARFGGRLASLTEIRAKSQPQRIQGHGRRQFLERGRRLPAPARTRRHRCSSRTAGPSSRRSTIAFSAWCRGAVARRRPGGGRFATIFNSQPRSNFDDANARFEWRPTDRDQLAVSTYIGHDDVDNSRELQLPTAVLERIAARGISFSGDFKITDVRNYRNTGLSVRWNRQWSQIFSTTMTVGRSDYDTITQRSSNVGGRQGGMGELNVVDDTTITVTAPITFNASHELTLGAPADGESCGV